MPKRKTLRVRQELVERIKEEVERGQYQSLSEFVSDAIQLRLQKIAKERIQEYLERDKKSSLPYRGLPQFYTPKHIWTQATPQGTAIIGITDYFQNQLKEIVNIQTDKPGEKVSKDEPFGVVETWWFLYDLYPPFNGKIVSVNKEVIGDPFILNVDPYQWIVEVQPENTEVDSWMNGLLSLGEYRKLVTKLEGSHRVKRPIMVNQRKTEGQKKYIPKWKTIRVRQELVTAAKSTLDKGHYRGLSELVSEAIRLRLDELKESHEKIGEKQAEYPLIHERLLYSPNHIWAMVTPEGNVRVGLSEYAQTHMKGIAGIQTDSVGCKVGKEEPFGVVETWMFMFDLYSPVSGKIVKINKALQDEPFVINKDPYEIAWIAEIKPNDIITLEEELRDLMKPHQYRMLISKLGRPRILGV